MIDILPLAIDEDFLCGLAQETMDILMDGLGMVGSESSSRAAEFLAEDPEIVAEVSSRSLSTYVNIDSLCTFYF